ncbi:MAG: hypothetical protein OFPII_30030 [Osedax symbiont Rs1]|nr:MAG: hypothetical protein OFPII_30030 [Osedax symbiont Rs1]
MHFSKLSILFISLSFSGLSFAQELQVIDAFYSCLKAESAQAKPRIGISLILKNVGSKNIKIITKIDTWTTIPTYDGKPPEITITKTEASIHGSPLIPPMDSLGIVELYPNDSTKVEYITSFLHGAIVERAELVFYSNSSVYSGRFNLWHGSVRAGVVELTQKELCKPVGSNS